MAKDMTGRETLLGLYETMETIRQFEMAASRLVAQAKLSGSVHVSIGQEAVAAGACAALRPTDLITSTHRGHGHCIAKGGDLTRMMAELMARRHGYAKGRGGSMHIADAELGILGANAIMAAGLPIATGAALSAQVRGTAQVAVAFLGDGAVAEGVFHESLNMAALWRLPVIFLCENNQYAELSHVSLHLNNTEVAAYAASYDMPGVRVDGNDSVAVRDTVFEAGERARRGEGPTLVEALTYRWHGHFEGDPATYRPTEEVGEWKARDPIAALARRLTDDGVATQEELDELASEAREAVEAAVEAAEQLEMGGREVLTEDVFGTSAYV